MESFKCIIQHIIINIVYDINSFWFFEESYVPFCSDEPWVYLWTIFITHFRTIATNLQCNSWQLTCLYYMPACRMLIIFFCVRMVPSWRSNWKKEALWIEIIYRVNTKLTIIPVCGLAIIHDAVWFMYVRYFFGF